MESETDWKEWHPLSIEKSFVVLLLNRPVENKFKKSVISLWNRAIFRIAVDGGAEHAHSLCQEFPEFSIPDIISGDFDSVDQHTLTYFKNKGVAVINTPDQNETDFTKALRVANTHLEKEVRKADGILAICSNGGRLDHVMGNIETLFHAQNITSCPVFLFSEESLSWLLKKGKHIIHIGPELEGTHCGLIPVGEPCTSVTTTGLKWNLVDGCLKFGELVSTSNSYDNPNEVTIKANSILLWTMELKK